MKKLMMVVMVMVISAVLIFWGITKLQISIEHPDMRGGVKGFMVFASGLFDVILGIGMALVAAKLNKR